MGLSLTCLWVHAVEGEPGVADECRQQCCAKFIRLIEQYGVFALCVCSQETTKVAFENTSHIELWHMHRTFLWTYRIDVSKKGTAPFYLGSGIHLLVSRRLPRITATYVFIVLGISNVSDASSVFVMESHHKQGIQAVHLNPAFT